MKKPIIYIETSIISYLGARPSSDLITAASQQVTSQWWEERRGFYNIVTSALVVTESSDGNPVAAQKRLGFLKNIPILTITEEVLKLSEILTRRGGALPKKAQADALHIAVAAVHYADYLLTWNCRHIDNPETKPLVRKICDLQGYSCPEICTPFELMEIDKYEK
jgi:hypothetical protein